jgi:hypothetical protein
MVYKMMRERAGDEAEHFLYLNLIDLVAQFVGW